jgi:hypothetical protein
MTSEARRAADTLDKEIRAGNTRQVLDLIDRFGLSAGDQIEVMRELDRRSGYDSGDVELRFDRFGGAHLVGIWERGIRERQRKALARQSRHL